MCINLEYVLNFVLDNKMGSFERENQILQSECGQNDSKFNRFVIKYNIFLQKDKF